MDMEVEVYAWVERRFVFCWCLLVMRMCKISVHDEGGGCGIRYHSDIAMRDRLEHSTHLDAYNKLEHSTRLGAYKAV
jgi:hypothetical protein